MKNDKDVRIVFMGTPEFAVGSLSMLVDNGYNIVGVITSPDKPAGRGKKIKFSDVKNYALQHNLKLLQPANLKDDNFIQELRSLQVDLQIVVAFRMLPEIVWSMPPLGTFNLHASLLPQYRGAAPINHAIINGEKQTGLTTFFLDKEIDTGKIIKQIVIDIKDDDDAGTLHDKMMNAGGKLVVETVNDIINESVKAIPQENITNNDKELKPAPKIFKDDCRIDWNNDAEKLYNFIRGLSPYPSAFTEIINASGTIFGLKIFKSVAEVKHTQMPVGSIICDGIGLKIVCKNGFLHIEELQLSGKKRMSTPDFLRGFKWDNTYKIC